MPADLLTYSSRLVAVVTTGIYHSSDLVVSLIFQIDGLADVSNAILRPDLSGSEQTRMFDKVARLIQLLLDNSTLFEPALHRARATAMLPMNDYLPEPNKEQQSSLYSSSPTKVMLEADQQTVTTRHAIHDEEQESEWRSDRERMAVSIFLPPDYDAKLDLILTCAIG